MKYFLMVLHALLYIYSGLLWFTLAMQFIWGRVNSFIRKVWLRRNRASRNCEWSPKYTNIYNFSEIFIALTSIIIWTGFKLSAPLSHRWTPDARSFIHSTNANLSIHICEVWILFAKEHRQVEEIWYLDSNKDMTCNKRSLWFFFSNNN